MKYEVIGRNHVAVPTHFFKVSLRISKLGATSGYPGTSGLRLQSCNKLFPQFEPASPIILQLEDHCWSEIVNTNKKKATLNVGLQVRALVFQVVVCETDTGKKELLTFVMPNKILPNDVDLKNYMVPLDTVERAAGLLIFDKIPKKAFSKINGKSTSFFG